MSQILLLVGHDDPQSLTHALAHRYREELAQAGLTTRRINLGELSFDPVLHRGYRVPQPLEPDLEQAQRAIAEAKHVTFFFPTWWAGPPALMKGFIDRVFLPGFAFRFEEGRSLPQQLLRGRSARVVSTMHAPRYWYWLSYRSSLHGAFVGATLKFSGFSPVATTFGYDMKSGPGDTRATRLLAQVAADARRDAARLRSRAASERGRVAAPGPSSELR